MGLFDKPGRVGVWLLLISGPAFIIIEPKALGWRLFLLALFAVGIAGLFVESNWVNQRREEFSIVRGDLSLSSRSSARTVFAVVSSIVVTVIFGVATWTNSEKVIAPESLQKIELDSPPETSRPFVKNPKLGIRLPTSDSKDAASDVQVSNRKSLKRRTAEIANEFSRWAEAKRKGAPETTIIHDGTRASEQSNDYQLARAAVYDDQAREEYDRKNFGPRVMAIVEVLKRCGIDVQSRAFWTNPIMMGNLGTAQQNALILRQIAVELPDTDAELKCSGN